MNLDRGELKQQARDSLRESRPSAYLVTAVYVLVCLVLGALSFRLENPGLDLRMLSVAQDWETAAAVFLAAPEPGLAGQLLNVAVVIMENIVGVGFISFCLLVSRGEAAGFGNLLDGFGVFFRALWLSILRGLIVMAWALPAFFGWGLWALWVLGMLGDIALWAGIILQIAGAVLALIAAYRYSMCYFLLLDAPDKPALQCLRESATLTQGHKGALFVLDLSFLGWTLLSAIPFVCLYTLPYIRTTWANYYRALSGQDEAPKHVDIVI